MKTMFLGLFLLAGGICGWSQFKNIVLANKPAGRFPPVEPSIIINQKDPKNIIAGIGVQRLVYTLNGGLSWSDTLLTSPFGVFGDPALVSDYNGHIYYFHLADPSGKGRSNDAWLDRMVLQKTTDGGRTWTTGTSIGHNPPKDQDKEWPAVHPTKPWVCLTWTQFDKYGSKDKACQSNILFSISKDTGHTWTSPVTINELFGDCIDDDNTTEGAVPAIDAAGNVYVAWSNKGSIYFDRSTDGGNTWLANDITVATHYGGWAMDIPGLNRCNGMPVLMVDNSPHKTNGHLYIVWADQKNGTHDTDIWLSKSTDKGSTWSQPLRVNKDGAGSQQFLPWLAIDQTTGFLYIVYYDRRSHSELATDVYMAWSEDGGQSFSETSISESPFLPTDEKFFGDYTNISAHAGVITPIWSRMDNGYSSTLACIIQQAALKKIKKKRVFTIVVPQ